MSGISCSLSHRFWLSYAPGLYSMNRLCSLQADIVFITLCLCDQDWSLYTYYMVMIANKDMHSAAVQGSEKNWPRNMMHQLQ